MPEKEYTCIVCFGFMQPKVEVVVAISPLDAIGILQAEHDLAHVNSILIFEGRLGNPKLSLKVT